MGVSVISFLVFGASQVGTPGPANMALMATGARFGFRAALPFVAGVALGKQLIIWPIGFGLMEVAAKVPGLFEALKWASIAYICWLAWKVANLRLGQPVAGVQAPGFWAGLVVHPLNPKAWVMLLLAWTEFGPKLGGSEVQWLVIPASFAGFQLVFHSLWALGGAGLGRYWQDSVLLHRALSLLTIAVILWAVLLA